MQVTFDSEDELETIIQDGYPKHGIVMVDGAAPDMLYRQMDLFPYGVADLVGVTITKRGVMVQIYELKKDKITASAITQAYRYRAAFENTLKQYDPSLNFSVEVTVVGTSIDDCAFTLNYTDINYYEAVFDPDSGIYFEDRSEGWAKLTGGAGSSVESVIKSVEECKAKHDLRVKEITADNKRLTAVK